VFIILRDASGEDLLDRVLDKRLCFAGDHAQAQEGLDNFLVIVARQPRHQIPADSIPRKTFACIAGVIAEALADSLQICKDLVVAEVKQGAD
jgi:hypothetical protein